MPILRTIQFLVLSLGLIIGGLAQAEMTMPMSSGHNPCAMEHHNPCNPCAGKNPCKMEGQNPCGMKHNNPCNPCGMKNHNPCGMMKHNPCNPCATQQKNPCGSAVNPCALKNPCSAKSALGDQFVNPNLYIRPQGTKLYQVGIGDRKNLIAEGEKLFNDTRLSSNGLSCSSCHSTNHLFKESFATQYPHQVQMTVDRSGYHKPVQTDEFVQFCIAVPLAGTPLAWDSRELAALTAYVREVKQKGFMKVVQGNNPCAMKHNNPCGMKNPCSKW